MQNFFGFFGFTSNMPELSESSLLNEISSKAHEELISAKLVIINEAEKLLLEEKKYSIEDFFDQGFIPFLIDCLKFTDLETHAAYLLTEIAIKFTPYAQAIIDYGAVPILIKSIIPSDFDMQCHCYNLLGFLFDQQPLIFDICMKFGLRDILISETRHSKKLDKWPYLSYFIGKCDPNLELLKNVEEFIFSLEKQYFPTKDDEILEDISIILMDLCENEKAICEMVVASGILKKLVPFLCMSRKDFTDNILTTFIAIADHKEFYKPLIESGILNAFEKLFMSTNVDDEIIEKILIFLIVHVLEPEIVEEIIKANLIYHLVDLSEWGAMTTQSSLTLLLILYGSNEKQALHIIKMNAIPAISNFIKQNLDDEFYETSLKTFFNVLQISEDANVKLICDEMEEYGIPDTIKILRTHENQEISDLAIKIIEMYFPRKMADDVDFDMNEKHDFEII